MTTRTTSVDLSALAARTEVLERAAADLEARHEDHLATAARTLRDVREAVAAGRPIRYVGALNLRGTWNRHQHESRMAAEVNRRANYARNVADPERYRSKAQGGGKKSLADHREDYLADLERWRDEAPGDVPGALARMLAELDLAGDLRRRAGADRQLAEVLSAGADDWRFDTDDRALAETELVGAIVEGQDLLAKVSEDGVQDNRPNGPTVIGYVRVSENEVDDADAQEEAIRAHAERTGSRVARIYRETAGGGVTDHRPALTAAVRHMEGPADARPEALIVARLDRLARSVAIVGRIMARATRRADGWALVALDLDLDTRNPAGRKAAAALIEGGRWRGEPTRQGLEEARERGAKLGRPRALAPETLARIRELRSGGESFRGIAKTLNDEKIPGSQGGRWHDQSVRRVLRLYGENDS